ncbi:DNA methyltransferase [Vibrio vulnificus]|uniref:DNA methyltransferase n=1 Tax=Vibrio vulnificus TaxID=672 RepID=UPI003241CC9B
MSTKRTQSGETTSDLILSSHTGTNDDLFPKILQLFVKEGSTIADVTYGKGVFWKKVDKTKYNIHFSDIDPNVKDQDKGVIPNIDSRDLPYENSSLDALVFDPPYMEGFYRRSETHLAGSSSHSSFREAYSNGTATKQTTDLKYHDLVVDMYMSSALEARRVLKDNGVYIVKCQDEVSANRQKLSHVEIIYGLEGLGFYCKDLYVLTRNNKPVVSKLKTQVHARKNHSYFLVFIKNAGKKGYSNCSDLVRSYWDKKTD